MDRPRLERVTHLFTGLPPWKKSLLMLAACCLVAGLGLRGIGFLVGAQEDPAGETRSSREAGGPERTLEPGRSRVEGLPSSKDPGSSFPAGSDERPDEWSRFLGLDESRGGFDRPVVAPDPLARRPAHDGWEEQVEAWRPSRFDEPRDFGERFPRREEGDRSIEDWSPALIKGGFSFFAAFCIGLALRAFAKISLVVIGSVFLTISSLAYGGIIEIHWERIGSIFDNVTGALGAGAGGFKSFLHGSLPSGVMGGLGFITGLKKG